MIVTWQNKVEFLERLTALTEAMPVLERRWLRDVALELCGRHEFEGKLAAIEHNARVEVIDAGTLGQATVPVR